MKVSHEPLKPTRFQLIIIPGGFLGMEQLRLLLLPLDEMTDRRSVTPRNMPVVPHEWNEVSCIRKLCDVRAQRRDLRALFSRNAQQP